MGQKTSKKGGPQTNKAAAGRKKSEVRNHAKNADTDIFNNGVLFNEQTQGVKVTSQDEQNPEWRNVASSENGSPFLRSSKNGNIKEFTSTKVQTTDCQNHNRIRRFRDKLAHQLQVADMQHILKTFLEEEILNKKEYCQIKTQLHTKWMCCRLVYTLERKFRNDDLKGKTVVFDLFLKCLRSPPICRSKLAKSLSRESGEPHPSWCSDGKVDDILDIADELILTPTLLEYMLSNVRCSNDQLSWWRWIPLELGLRHFSTNPESPEPTSESEHNKLKNSLYQWGTTEGFARGGLEILLLCFRNHDDVCNINWRGLEKLLKSRRYVT